MKRVLLKSVYDAFDYVMDHYYPYGQEDVAREKDSYAVISIQDTHTDGFGFEFTESRTCLGVLTLYFDDILPGAGSGVLFSAEDAEEIIDFILTHRRADTLLVHCYGGESRSRAVAAFAVRMFGKDDQAFFATGNPNQHVYSTLMAAWKRRQASVGK